jgi:hypothetical protein
MSAFQVDAEHINVMLWAARHYIPHYLGDMRWYSSNPQQAHQLTADNLDAVGQMLADANAASVNYRYDEHQEAYRYHYRRPRHTRWSIAEILNAVHCYEYQACEPAEWETSEAAAFCRSLTNTLIAALPGYRTGPWAIARSSEPAPAGGRGNNAKIRALEDVLNELSALRRRRAAVLEAGCDVVDFDEKEVDLLGDVATAAAAAVATL